MNTEQKLRIAASELQARISALEELMPEINRRLNLEDEEWVKGFVKDSKKICEKILAVNPDDPPHKSHFILGELQAACRALYQPWDYSRMLEAKKNELRNLQTQLESCEHGKNPDFTSRMMG